MKTKEELEKLQAGDLYLTETVGYTHKGLERREQEGARKISEQDKITFKHQRIMTHPTLYLSSEDKKLYVFDMPEKPKFKKCLTDCGLSTLSCECMEWVDYELSLKQAIANKVLVKDQEQAARQLYLQHINYSTNGMVLDDVMSQISKDTPYPLHGYEVTIKKESFHTGNFDYKIIEVAILTPVKEEKPKGSQSRRFRNRRGILCSL